jgi:hypothetical protein
MNWMNTTTVQTPCTWTWKIPLANPNPGTFSVTKTWHVYCTDGRPGKNQAVYFAENKDVKANGSCGPTWTGFVYVTITCPAIFDTPYETFTDYDYPNGNYHIWTAHMWDNTYSWFAPVGWCTQAQNAGYVQTQCKDIWFCGAV